MFKFSHLQLTPQMCCVCGQNNCQQATDHFKIKLNELKKVIENSGTYSKQLNELKTQIHELYKKIKQQFIFSLQKDERFVQERLNQFYYVNNSKIYHLPLLCQLKQCNYTHLPSKKIIKIFQNLNNYSQFPEQNYQLKQIKQDFNKFISELQLQKIITNFINQMPFNNVINKTLPFLNMGRSISDISNPQEINPQNLHSYSWKNIKIKYNTKIIQISNKNITDQDMIIQIPIFITFKHITTLEIRNNKISILSCKLIANNFHFLKSLDIRGNQIGDQGIIYIINGIINLKSLMISQTGVTDLCVDQIVQKLHNLELLWAEHNYITGIGAHKLALKPKLQILSLIGNRIEEKYFHEINHIFKNKGYLGY